MLEARYVKNLPGGMHSFDCVAGTVVSAGVKGTTIRLDCEIAGSDEGALPLAFTREPANIGERVLVTLCYFSKRYGTYIASIDSRCYGADARKAA